MEFCYKFAGLREYRKFSQIFGQSFKFDERFFRVLGFFFRRIEEKKQGFSYRITAIRAVGTLSSSRGGLANT